MSPPRPVGRAGSPGPAARYGRSARVVACSPTPSPRSSAPGCRISAPWAAARVASASSPIARTHQSAVGSGGPLKNPSPATSAASGGRPSAAGPSGPSSGSDEREDHVVDVRAAVDLVLELHGGADRHGDREDRDHGDRGAEPPPAAHGHHRARDDRGDEDREVAHLRGGGHRAAEGGQGQRDGAGRPLPGARDQQRGDPARHREGAEQPGGLAVRGDEEPRERRESQRGHRDEQHRGASETRRRGRPGRRRHDQPDERRVPPGHGRERHRAVAAEHRGPEHERGRRRRRHAARRARHHGEVRDDPALPRRDPVHGARDHPEAAEEPEAVAVVLHPEVRPVGSPRVRTTSDAAATPAPRASAIRRVPWPTSP